MTAIARLKRINFDPNIMIGKACIREMWMWKQYLRQKRRRRKGVKQKRGGIPNRMGIEFRPAIDYPIPIKSDRHLKNKSNSDCLPFILFICSGCPARVLFLVCFKYLLHK